MKPHACAHCPFTARRKDATGRPPHVRMWYHYKAKHNASRHHISCNPNCTTAKQ